MTKIKLSWLTKQESKAPKSKIKSSVFEFEFIVSNLAETASNLDTLMLTLESQCLLVLGWGVLYLSTVPNRKESDQVVTN